MTTEITSSGPPDAIDVLVGNLLSCGGVLSQIIRGMVDWDASGRSSTEVPIPEAAHGLIRSVTVPVARGHSKRDIKVAAKIVDQVTTAMCEDIFAVDPEWIDAVQAGEEPSNDEASAYEHDAPLGEEDPSVRDHFRADMAIDEGVAAFVVALVTTGRVLAGLVTSLGELDGVADAYPGEDPEDVALEMLYGSILTVLEEADPRDVLRATDLIEQANERTFDHLKLALELSRCLHEGDPGRD